MHATRPMPSPNDPSDEALVRQLAAGRQEPLAILHKRYASVIFNMAARSLDRATADEIVQDVFLTVWKSAVIFTAERGTFRAWALQIAHFRILNELRRRRRRPQLQADPNGQLLANLLDDGPEPEEVARHRSLRPLLQSAVRELPRAQRQAVDLAFLKELSHREVASVLGIPLGTAKTRIRSGLRNLRGKLGPAYG